MQKIKFSFVTVFLLITVSCAELQQIADETLSGEKPLTRSEIVAGLKEALIVGTNKSVEELGVLNGYYMDEMVKIYLPPEADVIVENVGKLPGGQDLIDDVLLRINRAAEDAVSEAKPIFVNAITGMTIPDAVDILKGEDDAATRYLQRTTYDRLYELYRPKIEVSLNKKLVGNVSTAESWNLLTDRWNELAGSVVGRVAGMKPVDVDLDEYLTSQALEGLFLKIQEEEQRIRENPAARVTELLRRVFGSVDT
ncbi:MAG: DUF4197 domain-containing protein [Prolixibacteraceae bacterium]